MGNKHLLLAYLMTALGYGGTFVAFTYLSADLAGGIRFPVNQHVSLILLLYGVARFHRQYRGR